MDTSEYISLIKENEIIWNKKDPNYDDMKRKAQTWDDISKKVGLNVEDCKKKWRAVRDRFCKLNKKLCGGENLDIEVYHEWRHFDELKFLKEVIKTRNKKRRKPLVSQKPVNSFQLNPEDEYHVRCAEIFITKLKYFVFHCSYCGKIFGNMRTFSDHLKKEHLSSQDWQNEVEDDLFDNLIEYENSDDDNDLYNAERLDECQQDKNTKIKIKKETENADEQEDDGDDGNEDCSSDEEEGKKNRKMKLVTTSFPNVTERVIKPMRIHTKWKNVQNSEDEVLERKYKCSFCPMAFKKNSVLRHHINRHTTDKKFPCMTCEKKFFTKSELEHHIRWHTGERPYLCELCGQGFISSSTLNEHKRRHFDERPYECSECKKCFHTSETLRNHLLTHTDERKHVCDICQATFRRRIAMLTHKKVHENKREYKCQYCDSAFNQKPGLLMHIRKLHKTLKDNEGKLFECTKCNINFTEISQFFKHMEIDHNQQQNDNDNDSNCDEMKTDFECTMNNESLVDEEDEFIETGVKFVIDDSIEMELIDSDGFDL